MKAIGLHTFGGPEVLEPIYLPDPRPGVGEVLIQVAAAAVNPTDVTLRSGVNAPALKAQSAGPWVPGVDVAGSVLAVGPRTGPSTPPQHEGDTVAAAVVQ